MNWNLASSGGYMEKQKQYRIVTILWFLAAVFFFIAAAIGKNTLFVCIGALYICIGCLYLAKGKSDSKNKSKQS